MKKLFMVLACIVIFPLIIVWEIFKMLIELADGKERARKRNGRHRGVMCGAGGSRRRR